jgi:hypothetical protein
MKLKYLVFLSTALLFSQQTSAVGKDTADRWFEMEVILFSQLGDKAQLKEQFPESTALPKYKKIIDLLGPYLSPDISSLKQQLPSCDAPVYPKSLLNQAIIKIKSTPYYQLKSLVELEETLINTFENAQAETDSITSTSLFSDGTQSKNLFENSSATRPNNSEITNHSQQADNEDNFYNNNRLSIENKEISQSSPANNQNGNSTSEAEQLLVDEQLLETEQIKELTLKELSIKVLSSEQLAQRAELLAQAENEFSAIQFNYHDETASFSQQLCTFSIEQFKQFNQKNTYENYTSFTIEKVPATINNNEDIYTDNNYLLSKASLKLHDIVKQLARSKNFKPLLHIGWRQKTKTKRLAVPIKIYAGENFAYQYQQELQQYQQQLKQAQAQENSLNQALFNSQTELETSNKNVLLEEALKQQVIAERIQALITEIPDTAQTPDELLNDIADNIAITTSKLNSTSMLTPPVKPPQDWTLEGFFKVEVDHFLHITADFNIMNMSLAQLATQQLMPESTKQHQTPLSTINFKQNRRVISKEIHYFDHPYIGMIVRILPYKKPKKEVDESIKAQDN